MSEEQNIPVENSKEQILKDESVIENILQEQSIEKPETANPKSENQKSEIENMEVHHHPDLHHRKKHWKEYFLEFLMIFLAVTLGFFAENLHEHFTDNEIEKNNIESVVKNLADDTSQLINVIKFNETRVNGIDSLLSLKKLDIRDTSVKKNIYYYGFLYAGYFLDFISNDATIEQMKTSGSLRLIKKQNIADSILKYEYINKVIKSNEDVLRFEYQKTLEMAAKLFNITIYNNSSIRQAFLDHNINGVNADELGDINTSDPPLLNEYYSYLTEQSLSLKYYLGLLVTQLNYARNLVAFLKKEYNLQ